MWKDRDYVCTLMSILTCCHHGPGDTQQVLGRVGEKEMLLVELVWLKGGHGEEQMQGGDRTCGCVGCVTRGWATTSWCPSRK